MGFKDENILTLGGTPEGTGTTVADITNAFRAQLINKCKPGDYALFYYSGHGTQIPDQNGDEADGKDEAIVPYDAGNTIESYITDDQLGAWTSQIKAAETLVILDSCHSGTGLARRRHAQVYRGRRIGICSTQSREQRPESDAASGQTFGRREKRRWRQPVSSAN